MLTSPVINYYNRTNLEYNLVLGRWKHLGMHFGYNDSHHHSISASILNMNRVLAHKASVRPNMKVLDAGCGVGGSAIWLAQHIGCHVTGITLVPQHASTAQSSAAKNKVSHLTNFTLQNFTHTNFPQNCFDIVWAIESTGHAPDKLKFLQEAYRILKPKGKLALADYFLTKTNYSLPEQSILNTFMAGWILPNLPTPKQYQHWLQSTGFTSIYDYHITPHIFAFSRWLATICKLLLPLARLGKFFRLMNEVEINNAQAAIAQHQALSQNLWQYHIFIAQKP